MQRRFALVGLQLDREQKNWKEDLQSIVILQEQFCLNSATAAEELNFRICGIGDGDEVIVPSYTYTASASAAIHCGAKVIFVDSQKDSTEMDYDKVAEVITEKTKAVVAVDLGGIICDYDKLYAAVESKKHCL